MHLTAGIIYLLPKRLPPCAGLYGHRCVDRCRSRRCLYCLSRKIHEKEIATRRQKNFSFWPDCIFRTGRGCCWNIAERGVYECFIRACMDSDRRLFELRLGLADFPLIQKGDLLRSKNNLCAVCGMYVRIGACGFRRGILRTYIMNTGSRLVPFLLTSAPSGAIISLRTVPRFRRGSGQP